jgi:hypothetical protein
MSVATLDRRAPILTGRRTWCRSDMNRNTTAKSSPSGPMMDDDFNYEAFHTRFEHILGTLIPDDSPDLTAAEIALVLCRLRVFLDEEGVPSEWQAELTERLVRPMISALQPIADSKPRELRRDWSNALRSMFDMDGPDDFAA